MTVRDFIRDIVGIVGGGLITAGAALVYVPAGLIVAGALLVLVAWLTARSR
jgi:hypothetical protein